MTAAKLITNSITVPTQPGCATALKEVLHPRQPKGSLVNEAVTRFDFSHFAKGPMKNYNASNTGSMGRSENIAPDERRRNVPVQEAMNMGAMVLFGEKVWVNSS